MRVLANSISKGITCGYIMNQLLTQFFSDNVKENTENKLSPIKMNINNNITQQSKINLNFNICYHKLDLLNLDYNNLIILSLNLLQFFFYIIIHFFILLVWNNISTLKFT